MARVVVKEAKLPMEIKPQKKSVFICMCGLSKNQPFCDSSHLKTKDEKKEKFINMMKKEINVIVVKKTITVAVVKMRSVAVRINKY